MKSQCIITSNNNNNNNNKVIYFRKHGFYQWKRKIGNCVNGYTFSQWGDMKYGECGFGSTHYSMICLNW